MTLYNIPNLPRRIFWHYCI